MNVSAVPRASTVGDFPTNFQFLSYSKSGAVDCIDLDISLSSGARFSSFLLLFLFLLLFCLHFYTIPSGYVINVFYLLFLTSFTVTLLWRFWENVMAINHLFII